MKYTRREVLMLTAGTAAATMASGSKALSAKERVDRAVAGKDVDRPPFSAWHHFLLEKQPPEQFAKATIEFHTQLGTDLIKVMSDFPYPKPSGAWYELKVETSPFPSQVEALKLIDKAVGGSNYFLETIFNPWNVAEKLSSKEEVLRLKTEQPQKLLDALDVMARSEANHARKAIASGACGIFLAIANANDGIQTQDDYAKFSEPFDKLILEAVKGARLNTLHLHGDHVYLSRFTKGWAATAINYSTHSTAVPISKLRAEYAGVIAAGLDENNFRKLTDAEISSQIKSAEAQAGKRFILAPGCSVPNDTTIAELSRIPKALGA